MRKRDRRETCEFFISKNAGESGTENKCRTLVRQPLMSHGCGNTCRAESVMEKIFLISDHRVWVFICVTKHLCITNGAHNGTGCFSDVIALLSATNNVIYPLR